MPGTLSQKPRLRDGSWLQELAAKRNGICHSTEYLGVSAKYLWECEKGHRWLAKANTIQNGSWCLICSGCARHDINHLRTLAKAHGGLCHSTEYVNAHTEYEWECENHHRWKAKSNTIANGNWCGACSEVIRKDTNWLQVLASRRQGKCLSEVYKNSKTKYQWECLVGHIWDATANDIQAGKWCPHCSGKAPHNLLWLTDIIHGRGRCLSVEYKGIDAKYEWECLSGHTWQATAHDVSQGSGCPVCARKQSKKELEVFDWVKSLYPDAVSGERGVLPNKRYQLDIFIPSLSKAIEFDGHRWHKSEWALSKGQGERDASKDRLCVEAGISLLRIDEKDFDRDPEAVFLKIGEFLGRNLHQEASNENTALPVCVE